MDEWFIRGSSEVVASISLDESLWDRVYRSGCGLLPSKATNEWVNEGDFLLLFKAHTTYEMTVYVEYAEDDVIGFQVVRSDIDTFEQRINGEML